MKSSILAGAGLAVASGAYAQSTPVPFSINIFSKNLQWLNYSDMANLAAEIGFEGIDLTVRPNGHVEPARVADDLPRAVEAVRRAGIHIPMITTGILSATEKDTEHILKTAGSLGVRSYRMGWLRYDEKVSIDDNLKKFGDDFKNLEALNMKYKIRGEYQNHSGAYLGSAVWDIAGILKKCDPRWMGLQYDVLHATVEGANAWPLGLRQASSHVTSLPIKDFQWSKKDDKWVTELVPLSKGMVDFTKFFSLIKSLGIDGPFSMHFEYPLGGVENGTTKLSIDKSEVVNSMTRDLKKFRQMLNTARIR
jgi:L-ribulose-5-phosphate 3-epimerase